jgi:hypothetical protein
MRQTYSFDSSPFQDGQQAFIGLQKYNQGWQSPPQADALLN